MLKTIQPTSHGITALFSKTIFKTCLVRDSSSISSFMDRYINKCLQISNTNLTNFGPAVCILGKSGIGKTWYVNNELQGNFIDLTADILKTKQKTIDFLERVKSSPLPIVIDEYEAVCDLVGLWEIKKVPSKGQFIVISQIPVKFDFKIETWKFPVPGRSDILKIVPDAPDDLINEADGDLRFVIRGMNFKSAEKDAFETPRDFVTKLLSNKTSINPVKYIGDPLSEPGNIVSIVQENYVDAVGARHDIISDFFSTSEIFDEKIYDGHWQLLPYYSFFGCIQPAIEIRHSLDPSKIRPGSVWTKFQNICMRTKRLHAMARRRARTLTRDDILLLKIYAENENIEILKEYGIEPQDLDVMNHLSSHKIKAKTLVTLKKCLGQTAAALPKKKST